MKRDRLHRLAEIGIALSSEQNIDKLLEMIVDGARSLTGADAGTLYLVDEKERHLRFEILHNDTLEIRMGGTSDLEITFPPVPLEILGKPNHANVSSYVALTEEIVNIVDIYQAEGFDFTGARTYDAATEYRSQSILVIPMKNHENDIIGVLQLLNAKDPKSGEVISFKSEVVDLVASLASQAAVALTNRQLIEDSSNLFEAFLKSIASAIDEKSPYTGGHIRRVTELTMMIAEKVNESTEGPFADVHFDDNDLEELHTAAWMHDMGKIVLPEHVVSKKNKLETVFDRIHLISTRFQLIRQAKENEYLKLRLEQLESGKADQSALEKLEVRLQQEIKNLQEEEEFLVSCNKPRENMAQERVERLKEIAQKTYRVDGAQHRYLSDEELLNLSIRRGSLISEEREIIQNHAIVSIRMLNDLPFPKKLSHVPEYAGAHHEKLDGSGYPLGLTADQLSVQARIIAIADIFESLTARDRPYREPTELSEVLTILRGMKDNDHIDPDLFDLLLSSGLYEEYTERIRGSTTS
ncbi:GAF domain-containing protein [Acidobacteria bacterium AH-259-D05]|nr:GAF domain-containing protein [Acidobacteria bacterium AH-259-D05]